MKNDIKRKLLVLILFLVLSLAVGACTRSASTPPPSPDTSVIPAEGITGQQATMEAVRSALLTQTAQAQAPLEEPTETMEPTVIVPAETPLPENTQEAEATSEGTEPDATAAPGTSTEYTVLQGDWVNSIAGKFGVEAQAIIDLNNLEAPYTLTVGQVLQIPSAGSPTAAPATASPTQAATSPASGTSYTVLEGEWVYSIARKFGVDPQAIIDTNNLVSPYTLHPGDVLIIP